MKKKLCKKCNQEKILDEMTKAKDRPSGYKFLCKKCDSKKSSEYKKNNPEIVKKWYENNIESIKEKSKKYKKENPEKVKKYRKKWYDNNKELSKENSKKWRENNPEISKERSKNWAKKYKEENPEKVKLYEKEWVKNNPEKVKNKSKKYYEKNKEKIGIYSKNYRKNNPEKIRLRKKIYNNKKTKNDMLFKCKENIRKLILLSIKKQKFKKNSKTAEILGCTYEKFKSYIENKWQPWMNWNNHGKHNGQFNYGWDFDHIIPIASAKTQEDVIRLNHYTNFQPLCSHINRDIKKDNLNYQNPNPNEKT